MTHYRYPHVDALKEMTLADMHFLITLYEKGSLSVTSRLSAMSVASGSRRLAQCRTIFNDELFIRSGQRMMPTRTMEGLVGHLRDILTATERLVVKQEDYSITGEARPARIIATDSGIASIVSSIVEDFNRDAPMSQLSILPYTGQCLDHLRTGDADLVFLPEAVPLPPDFNSATLYDTDFVVVASRQHRLYQLYLERGFLSQDDLIGERSIRIVTSNHGSSVPHPLDLKVGMETPYFLSVPDLVSKTDLVFLSPRTMVERFLSMGQPVVVMPVPDITQRFAPLMVWHQSTQIDPFYQWLRQLIQQACKRMVRDCERQNFAPVLKPYDAQTDAVSIETHTNLA